jgi:hypothetical protein
MSKCTYCAFAPFKWRAGFTGQGENAKPFYFQCADCGSELLAGGLFSRSPGEDEAASLDRVAILAPKPKIENGVQIWAADTPLPKHALYCQACFDKQVAEAKQSEATMIETGLGV